MECILQVYIYYLVSSRAWMQVYIYINNNIIFAYNNIIPKIVGDQLLYIY
ncbi:hypothetical protein Hanom_Chr16g01420091 [Helianthus anomalus]